MTKWNSITQQHKRANAFWRSPPELPKDHEGVPDIDLGLFYRRQEDGALQIFLEGTHLTPRSTYVVLGKYAEPKEDGVLYYVTKRSGAWHTIADIRYFDNIILAVACVVELKEQFDKEKSS